MDLTEKKISGVVLYDGKIIKAELDDVLLPNGAAAKREIVRHPGGVCIAALNEKNELAFVRQFRYAYAEVVTELPAGKLERGEDPFEAAKRELQEETGARAVAWKDMGLLYPSPGYTDEIIHLYACRIESIGNTNPDDDEFLEAEYIPIEKAVGLVMDNTLTDSKTQTLIMKVYFALKNQADFLK